MDESVAEPTVEPEVETLAEAPAATVEPQPTEFAAAGLDHEIPPLPAPPPEFETNHEPVEEPMLSWGGADVPEEPLADLPDEFPVEAEPVATAPVEPVITPDPESGCPASEVAQPDPTSEPGFLSREPEPDSSSVSSESNQRFLRPAGRRPIGEVEVPERQLDTPPLDRSTAAGLGPDHLGSDLNTPAYTRKYMD